MAKVTFSVFSDIHYYPGVFMSNAPERLEKIHEARKEVDKYYSEAFVNSQESDYYQEKLDAALRGIFGEIDPFNKRYPYLKGWNYNKPMKGK